MPKLTPKDQAAVLKVLANEELLEVERHAWLAIWLANLRGEPVPQDEIGFRSATKWHSDSFSMDAVESLARMGLCTVSAKGCVATIKDAFDNEGDMGFDELLATSQRGIESILHRGIAGLTVNRRDMANWVVRVPAYWSGFGAATVQVVDRRYYNPDERFFVVTDLGSASALAGADKAKRAAVVYGADFEGGEIRCNVGGAYEFLPMVVRVAGAISLACSGVHF